MHGNDESDGRPYLVGLTDPGSLDYYFSVVRAQRSNSQNFQRCITFKWWSQHQDIYISLRVLFSTSNCVVHTLVFSFLWGISLSVLIWLEYTLAKMPWPERWWQNFSKLESHHFVAMRTLLNKWQWTHVVYWLVQSVDVGLCGELSKVQ